MNWINTTEYEFAHGKKPRGFGRWALVPSDYDYGSGSQIPEDGILWVHDKFGEARREAARLFPGVHQWTVLP
jgi:hypothetical protein